MNFLCLCQETCLHDHFVIWFMATGSQVLSFLSLVILELHVVNEGAMRTSWRLSLSAAMSRLGSGGKQDFLNHQSLNCEPVLAASPFILLCDRGWNLQGIFG